MPYATVRELPVPFKVLPTEAKHIAMDAANEVFKRGGSDQAAMKAAWTRVKQKYRKAGDGEGDKWVKKAARRQRRRRKAGFSFGALPGAAVAKMGGVSHDDLRTLLQRKVAPPRRSEASDVPSRPYVREVYDDHIILELPGGKHESRSYSRTEAGQVEVESAGTPVMQAWVPVDEKAMLRSAEEPPQSPSRILKADEEQRVVWGVVYAADDEAIQKWQDAGGEAKDAPKRLVDSQGDWMSEQALRGAFLRYMKHYAEDAKSGQLPIRLKHREALGGTTMLESALLMKGTRWPTPASAPLDAAVTWVMAHHIGEEADEVWQAVKKGEITGYSIGGWARE
jgi:cation transport regulator ChaB